MGQKASTDPNKPSMDGINHDIGVDVNYASVADTSNILKELEQRDLSKEDFVKLQKICDKKKWERGNKE